MSDGRIRKIRRAPANASRSNQLARIRLVLIESPEPLGPDVSIRLFQNSAEQPSLTLVDKAASRMLVVCDAPPTGDIRLEFLLDRSRYRAMVSDGQSKLQETSSVSFQL